MSCAHQVSILILIRPEKQLRKSKNKVDKNDGRITPKAHARLQTMTKTSAKFKKVLYIREVGPQATHVIVSQPKNYEVVKR